MANQIQVRIPPHSVDAEESVLGALLLDRDAVIAVAEFLGSEDFYDDRHREIFICALELYEERIPIDVLTIADRLKKRKVLKKIGGAGYLADLANKVPTAAHVEHYGKIVKDQATKRSLMKAASTLLDLSLDEGLAASELLDKAESQVFSLTQKHLAQTFTPVKDALAESFDRLDELHKQAEGLRGIPTGFRDIDDTLAGLQRSNLIILAARPGVGKTSLALNIAQNLTVKSKLPVGFFSLEMSKEELVDRLLVSQADIDAWRLKTGKLSEDDFTRLSNAMGELAEAPLYIDDTPALSILEMRTKARRLQVEAGVSLLIVDYFLLLGRFYWFGFGSTSTWVYKITNFPCSVAYLWLEKKPNPWWYSIFGHRFEWLFNDEIGILLAGWIFTLLQALLLTILFLRLRRRWQQRLISKMETN